MPRYQGKALVGALKSGRSAAIRVVPRSEIVPEASCFCFFLAIWSSIACSGGAWKEEQNATRCNERIDSNERQMKGCISL